MIDKNELINLFRTYIDENTTADNAQTRHILRYMNDDDTFEPLAESDTFSVIDEFVSAIIELNANGYIS